MNPWQEYAHELRVLRQYQFEQVLDHFHVPSAKLTGRPVTVRIPLSGVIEDGI